jgi:two-component system alkaline phosphatase synthesis response regulator PhoP
VVAKPIPKLLLVEDDETLLLGLELNLRAEGFDVLSARDGITGLEIAREQLPDAIVLDIQLPRRNGLSLLDELRRDGLEMPVLILSARGEVEDKLQGLGLGADDYITKPFSLPELVARIRAALRRPTQARTNREQRRFGDTVIDFAARIVLRRGAEVNLTSREFELLAYLVRHAGRVHSREQLLTAVWGYDYEGTARTVDNFVRSLRVKIEDSPTEPRHLLTVRGAGYRFET